MRPIKIHIVDYGIGNVHSVRNAFEHLGCEVTVSESPADFDCADALILPGVGAFGEAMGKLRRRGLVDPLRHIVLKEKKPLLGVCLGMQLLAEGSDERGKMEGLALIPGWVRKIPVSAEYKLPHIGWNSITISKNAPLFRDIHDGATFYFVHSYRFECEPSYISASTDYDVEIAAAVQCARIFGVQFHPERSQQKGLHLLKNFVDFVELTI